MVPTLALAGSSPAGPLAHGRVIDTSFRSLAVRGVVRMAVYLPPGYASGTLRYPVVYFLHGLPASPETYRGVDFLRHALDRVGRPAILVAPQGARDGDSDPEYLDWGPGRDWETAVGRELPRFVDRSFRTIRSRRARAIVGLSAGGYGATLLALHHLESRPTFFAFYVGRGDSLFRAENLRLHRELVAAGVPHLFRLYPGAHAQTVWSAHSVAWLRLALTHLEPARAT